MTFDDDAFDGESFSLGESSVPVNLPAPSRGFKAGKQIDWAKRAREDEERMVRVMRGKWK